MTILFTVTLVFLSTALAVTGFVHVYWALGGRWPATDERTLARAVVGTPGVTRMPPRGPTLTVAAALFVAALVPLLQLVLPTPLPASLVGTGSLGFGCVFAVRGVAGYTPWFRSRHKEEPFATLDKRVYSPLCLLIATGFVVLSLGH